MKAGMGKRVRQISVFVASPSDVGPERERLAIEIERLNNTLGEQLGVTLKLWRWEKDATPGLGEPQDLINPELDKADIVVVILWNRFGTDASDGKTGTETEASRSIERWKASARPHVMMYFCQRLARLKTKEEHDQAARVLEFRKLTEPNALVIEYEEVAQFGDRVHDDLHKVVEKILPRRRGRGRNPTAPPPSPSREVRDYLDRAAGIHESISLAGFETKVRASINLDELHVPLRAMIEPAATEVFGGAKEAHDKLHGRETAREVTLADAFGCAKDHGNRRGIVLLGDPGSGKTTQLKRLLLAIARDDAESLKLPAGVVPVFLALRNLTDPDGDLEAFLKQELRREELRTAEGFAQRLLDEGSVLFLLDGLDEIAALADRERIAGRIEKLRKAYPKSWFVVTCRYAGYTKNARLSEHFLEMHLKSLDDDQVSQFIKNWFRIVETSLTADKDAAVIKARQTADELIARLHESDFRSGRVSELTHNPLLLTTICLVHRDRGRLPHRRAELYDECVNILLERWRDAKGAKVRIPAASARSVLHPVAHWMHSEDNRILATEAELTPVIEPLLSSAEGLPKTASEFLAAIRDESGLLTGWSGDRYGFMHLGFQEYLTARECLSRIIRSEDGVEALARRFGESWWQEVILLFLGLQDAPFEMFMSVVVDHPAFVTRGDLVDMCIGDALRRTPSPFLGLVDRPPGNDKELWSRQLAALLVLERTWPDEIRRRAPDLSKHPSSEVRARFGTEAPVVDSIVFEPSGCPLVRIPGGTFMMGSAKSDDESHDDERPQHQVTVRDFLLGQHPLTNEEYGRYLKANPKVAPPEYWSDRQYNRPAQPVVGVSWQDARGYCRWAGLRLPSEAEWEYACRARTTTRYWSGNGEADLARVAWYDKNASGRLHAVGEKPANEFGLHDMHGNVWEWCEDTWHSKYKSPPADGSAWTEFSSVDRVIRGGSFASGARYARAAFRYYGLPSDRLQNFGFRPARSVDA